MREAAPIRTNMFYSMLLTGANYLFPLAVYTWISRVLGVANIGLVGFVDSVTVYFILFSMMGISVLGMKAISQARNDPRRLSESFWSLLTLHATFTLIVLGAMIAATFLVDELYDNRQLMYVGMCKLIFNVFLVEWQFTGLEQFRYITIRTLIVKSIYVLSVFLFVRSPEDTMTYYVLTMLVVVAMAVVNMLYACHEVGWHNVKLKIRQYVAPFFSLGLYAVVTSSYATFNMAFLGFVSDDTSVGYFSTASKIILLACVIFTAYVSVMAPRANRFRAEGNVEKFRALSRTSFISIMVIGITAGALIFTLAPWLVRILSGPGYDGAVLPLRIMSPFLVVIGMSQMISVQILVPAGREKLVAIYAAAGFAVCIALNIILTPHYGSAGSAISWIAAEATTLLLAICNRKGLRPAARDVQ